MSKNRFLVLAALLVVVLAAGSAFAGAEGGGVSGVQVQNLTTSKNTVTVQLHPQSGGNVISLDPVEIQSEAAENFYLPSLNQVGAGSYAMVVSAQQQVGAIARTDFAQNGGAAIYSNVAPGKEVIIPLVLQKFAGQTSQFSVQNAGGTNVSDVKIEVIARGSGNVVKTLANESINAGASKSYDLADTNTFGTLPNTATDLGSNGFVGAIKITSAANLVAQSFIDIPGTAGITGFSGVSTSSAGTNLYCPLARDNFFGNTGIQIVNQTGDEATVDITFRSDPASPNKGTFTQQIKIPGNSSDIAFQGPGGNSRAAPTNLPGGTQTTSSTALTNDGFFGTATLSSDKNIIAVVNDVEFGANFSVLGQSTYTCVPSSGVGKEHYAPLLRRFHLADTKLTTGIQVMNVTGNQNTVSLDLKNFDGNDIANDPANKTADPNGPVNFFGGDWTGLPTVPANLGGSGWFGSGKITCTEDCVILVSDEGFGNKKVDRANYLGIKK